MFARLHQAADHIINEVISLIYFMRGAISYETAMFRLSFAERQRANDFISKRLEQESKSPHPVY